MSTVIIVIHLMVVLAMIGLILLQRSEGGALGIGGGSGAFLTGRSAGNVLSHTTGWLAVAFFATSLALALLGKYQSRPSDILERLPGPTAPVTSETPAAPAPSGAPTSAQDLLNQLGGSSGGPQTPPAPAPEGSAPPAAPAPAAETPAPAAETPAPATPNAAPATAPSPRTPPAGQ